jgi:hypothetical protein
MIYKTGNSGFDAAALAVENVRAAAERVPGLTQAAATTAARNYFTSIIAAGASFGVLTANEQSALNAINSTGAP